MNARKLLNQKRIRRKARSRAKVFGVSARPRLAVFRSNRFIYAQLVDDDKSHTLVYASSKDVSKTGKKPKVDIARMVGKLLAEKAAKAGVKTAIFDRRAYKYQGRIRALAEGAREGGLKI